MLPITSKHLTVQIITTSILITCMLLSSFYQTTDCLPITSKPIESTVENLAWEAWLMVPVGQQQKSRKVTPKSIFIVPQKKNQSAAIQCPPGEHLFESRCIPTVNIDTEKLLLEELTNFVVSPGVVYDYDYDEDINDSVSAEKLEGTSDVIESSNSNTADAPLKFDIFRDHFPIGSSGSGDSSGNRDSEDDNILFMGGRRRRPPIPVEGDLDTQGSSYGSNHDDDDGADDHSTLFLSGIDAILVPAVSGVQEKDQNLNFSIYQDAVNTTAANTDIEILTSASEKVTDLEKILKNDSLFLDKDHELGENDTTTTEKSETTTDQFEGETTTMKLEDDADVESKTEFVRSVTEVEEESTDSTEDTSTLTTEDDEKNATTTMEPSEEATTSTDNDEITTIIAANDETTTNKEEITTMISSSTKIDEKDAAIESFAELVPNPDASGDRFLYEHQSEAKPQPEVMDINAELKIINELVAKNRKLLSTTTSSVESNSKSSSSWARIIPKIDTSGTASSTSSSTMSVSSSGSSSSSSSSSDSSSSSSTESSTDNNSSSSPSASSTAETPAMGKSDPFWWLPTGWRVDRTEADRPLLLRFWSALSGASGSQTKV